MLIKIGQTHKVKYHVSSYMWNLKRKGMVDSK